MSDIIDVTTIRKLNDQFRQSLRGGVLVMTAGVIALGQDRQLKILEAVSKFDPFDEDNDPYGEHDFGALTVSATPCSLAKWRSAALASSYRQIGQGSAQRR